MQDTPNTIYISYANTERDGIKQEAWTALLPLRTSITRHFSGLQAFLGPSKALELAEELRSRYPNERLDILGPDQTDLGARSAHILARQYAETELKYPHHQNQST